MRPAILLIALGFLIQLPTARAAVQQHGAAAVTISPEELLLTPYRDLRDRYGLRLNLVQRIGWKLARRAFRRQTRKARSAAPSAAGFSQRQPVPAAHRPRGEAATHQAGNSARAKPARNPRSKAAKPNKLGRIGLILGIAGIVFLFIPFVSVLSFFLAIAAIVLGIIGIGRDEKPGMAIASLVLGGTVVVLLLLGLVLFVIGGALVV